MSFVASSAQSATSTEENWWRQAAVYQIYPRSFADANGDGLGDIPGIVSRIDYLVALGIDAVWLSPFYPSELADGGYDVADYRNVDPRLGTLDDFDEMVTALHANGIKVVVDIVPNHTSDHHEWFVEALAAAPGSPARERYMFRDGVGENGDEAPANWKSTFGGPAWHRVEDGQWYFAHFAKEQPDLNWANPEVREDFLKTLRFWADRGVDGFRIDVAHMLTKDFADTLPSQAELDEMPRDGQHPLIDRDDVHEIYAEWRKVFNSYDPPRTAVAEAWVAPDRVPRYASPEGLGQSFNFELLEANFEAKDFRDIVTRNLALAAKSGSSSTWVLSNHDVVRHPTRYGTPERFLESGMPVRHGGSWLIEGGKAEDIEQELGLERATAATMFMLALPGSSYLYQGEELGLQEVGDIPAADRQDPTFFRTNGEEIGRDGCRVPLPWEVDGPSLGFGSTTPHLPQPAWFANYAVAKEAVDGGSVLNLYRRALALRHELQTDETLEWEETGDTNVLRFRRPNGWTVITNFGDAPYALDSNDRVLLSSSGETEAVAPRSTVWIAAQ